MTHYFYKPYYAALEYPELTTAELGYWCPPFRFNGGDIDVITYSIPLRTSDGNVFGILGIELACDYLRYRLPYAELNPDNTGLYLVALGHPNDPNFQSLFASNDSASYLPTGTHIQFLFDPEPQFDFAYRITLPSHQDVDLYGCIQYFDLYGTDSPFREDQWALVGVLNSKSLFGLSDIISFNIITTAIFSLAVALIAVFFIQRIMSRPIVLLMRKIRTSDPHLPIRFDRVYVSEIDELAAAVESLRSDVAATASRLSSILEMTSTAIGAFECRIPEGVTYYTDHLFEVLGLSVQEGESPGVMKNKQFTELMSSLPLPENHDPNEDEVVIWFRDKKGEPHWVGIRITRSPGRVFGVAEDITTEVLEKQKLEYERDHDLMTGLLNRRAFYTSLDALFERPQLLKTGAMVMFDLDNLKYINDTYGHDYGDLYIRTIAEALKTHAPQPHSLARLSGDEFYFFSYYYEDRETLLREIQKMKEEIDHTLMPLPDNPNFHLRSSAGVAWFPDDSSDYDQLMRYADFAMYTTKHTSKGELREFCLQDYTRESYLLYNNEDLNHLLDDNLLVYDYQPIVDASTGKIFGYEALMRSKLETLKSPEEILSLARAQSKLHLIERYTWKNALKGFAELCGQRRDYHFFINSLPNQIISPDEICELEQNYRDILPNIVIELTEKDPQNDRYMRDKLQLARKWGAKIALDGFGSGYNGDSMLIQIEPDYIKINLKLIRGIDTDKKRYQLLENLLFYTKEHGILVIAEGIETRTEMETLILSGVEYLQGFYIGRPDEKLSHPAPQLQAEIRLANPHEPDSVAI